PQADGDLDTAAAQRVAQIERLCASLRSPTDYPDAVDPSEGLGQPGEEMPAADQHPLGGAGKADVEELEETRFGAAHSSPLYARPDDAYSDIPTSSRCGTGNMSRGPCSNTSRSTSSSSSPARRTSVGPLAHAT